MSNVKTTEPIETIRHSLSHVMAAAIKELWPNAKFAIGPSIDNGFYYDIDFGDIKINEENLKDIAKKTEHILKQNLKFERMELDVSEALNKEKSAGQIYKQELIEELIKTGEKTVSYYKLGNFEDLCRGPHVESTNKIAKGSFKLNKLAGSYWRGDEKNKMLTRIYGLAFATKEELENYLKMMEEAEKRDHRKLGKELELFTFDEDTGPGLPLWLPKGTIIVDELEKLAKEKEAEDGYVRVRTPHIAKESMYLKSGHLPYYEDSMFPPMEYEGVKYYLKAMNCPHHHKIFGIRTRAHKELPLRLAEYGTVYRHEKSGELFGLMRVRMLSMNDAHIYCTEEQFADEFKRVNKMYLDYFKIFNIDKYVMRFSTHDPKKLGEKYVDEPELWKKTEDMVRNILIEAKIPYVEIPNEAAFYGPKIDVQVWSAIGKEFTLATNQVDFAVPKRFDLKYFDKTGKEQTPLCIHRAPLGTHERFIGFLIEHYAGAFPVWMSPVQVKILSVSEAHIGHARKLAAEFMKLNIRTEVDENNETVGNKIRKAANEKVPYTLVIGDSEMNSDKLAVRDRGSRETRKISKSDFMAELKEKIENRN